MTLGVIIMCTRLDGELACAIYSNGLLHFELVKEVFAICSNWLIHYGLLKDVFASELFIMNT